MTASSMCTSVVPVRKLSLTRTLPCSCWLLGRTNILPLQGKERHKWLGPHLVSGSFLPWSRCWHCLSWSSHSTGQETVRGVMSLAKHSSLIMHVASTPLHVGYHVDEAQKSQPPPFACVPLRSYALLGCAALSSGQD